MEKVETLEKRVNAMSMEMEEQKRRISELELQLQEKGAPVHKTGALPFSVDQGSALTAYFHHIGFTFLPAISEAILEYFMSLLFLKLFCKQIQDDGIKIKI